MRGISLPVVRRARRSSCGPPRVGERVGRRRRSASRSPASTAANMSSIASRQQLGPAQHVHEPEADARRGERRHQLRRDRLRRAARGRPGRSAPAGRTAPARRATASNVRPPIISSTTSTRSPPLASRSAAVRSSAPESTVASAPRRSASARFSGRRGDADHAAGAEALGELDRQRADAAGGGVHDHGLALAQLRAGAQQVPRGRALQDERERLRRRHAVGHLPDRAPGARRRARRSRRRPSSATTRRPSGVVPTTSPPGHQRQRRLGQVGVLGLVGVGVVDARRAHLHQHAALGRARARRPRAARAPRARRTPVTWMRLHSLDEQVDRQLGVRPPYEYWLRSVTPSSASTSSHRKKLPVHSRLGRVSDRVRGVGHQLGLARAAPSPRRRPAGSGRRRWRRASAATAS